MEDDILTEDERASRRLLYWITKLWKKKPAGHRFIAFISYKHNTDSNFARSLEYSIKKYGRKWWHLPDSIFRDEHYIRPSEPIGETIRRALSRSEYLIYLASPQAATSRWVYDELEYWLSDPERSKRFLVVVTDGVFEFSAQQKEMIDKKRTDIFPKALVPKLAQPGLLIDFRNHEATAQLNLDDPNTKAKINQIVAKLKGITPGEMIDRALLESRRLRRFRTISFCVLIILMTMGMTASWLAWKQLNIALMAESRAIAQLSHQERRRGNATRAIATALSALPDYDRVLKRPLSSEAQRALVEARYERREIGVLKGHRMGYISTIGINPGQDTIWSGSHDGTVRLWSLKTGRALALLSGHQESISQVRFNEDASLIASASTDDTVRLWRADNGWIEPSVLHHSFDVTALVLSASGTTLITTSSNREGAVIDFEGAVTVWSTISGAKLSELRGESFGGGQTVFRLKDGKFIVGLQANTLILELMDDGDLKVLNTFEGVSILALDPHEENFIGQSAGGAQIRRINDGVLVASLEDHLDLVQAADISPDGKFAVTGSRDGTARLWQVATGRLLAILRGHEDWVTSVAFSTNGEKVVTASDDGAARLFDVRLDSSARYNAGHPLHGSTIGRQIAEFRGHLAPVSEAMFAPGDEMVITAAGDGTVRTWRSGIGVEITRLDTHDGRLSGAFFGSDGNWLVSGPLPGEEAFVWSTTEGKRGRSLGTNVVASAVSPKVDVVATVDDTGLQLRNAITLEIIGEFPARSGLGKPHFSPDGLRVAVKNHFSDNISLLSGENAHQFAQIEAPADLRSFVFSPDGKALLTWSSDNTASLWDSETGAEERIFQGHTGPVNSATFSHDGNYVITGSDDETVIVWERFTGAQRTRFGRLAGAVTSVAAQENGSQIAAATIGGKAYVWTSAADTAPMVLSGDHIFSSGEIAFTLDGQRLIRRSVTGEIVVWETATGRQLLATEQNVTSGANWGFIGPNGRIMATPTGADVTIFDLTDGSKVANLRGHLSEVDHVMFSPDGRKLLTSAIDEQSLVWPIFEIDAEFLSDSKEIVTRLRMP